MGQPTYSHQFNDRTVLPSVGGGRAKRLATTLIFCLVVLPMAMPSLAKESDHSFLSPLKKVFSFGKSTPAPLVAQNSTVSPTLASLETLLDNAPQGELGDVKPPLLPVAVEPESKVPTLFALLQAEFAMNRGDPETALALYKKEASKENSASVFERALGLSLQLESPDKSLAFAKAWQDNNQDHIPVWFYVTHLALKSGDYDMAANNLNMILEYDPDADLRRIFEGILPADRTDQQALAHALEIVSGDKNPSLSALKAVLFAQLGQHDVALLWANQAILAQPKNLAFLTLKADMLNGMGRSDKLHQFLNKSIKDTTGDTQRQLYLYQIRQLIDQNKLPMAWKILKIAHAKFPEDNELTLLTALVGLDVKAYGDAIKILTKLTTQDGYADQARYYLGVAYERQFQVETAIGYFEAINDPEWLMSAKKKTLTHHLNRQDLDKAMSLLIDLRHDHPSFASDSYALQADILVKLGKKADAKALLQEAVSNHPDDAVLLFSGSQLLDDDKEYGQKLDNFIKLQQLEPYNPRYQFEQARLILLKNPLDNLALSDVVKVSQLHPSHPDYDPALYRDALVVLAQSDLVRGKFLAVIERLSPPYAEQPNLAMGQLLLRAYYALGNKDKVNELLAELTVRPPATPASDLIETKTKDNQATNQPATPPNKADDEVPMVVPDPSQIADLDADEPASVGSDDDGETPVGEAGNGILPAPKMDKKAEPIKQDLGNQTPSDSPKPEKPKPEKPKSNNADSHKSTPKDGEKSSEQGDKPLAQKGVNPPKQERAILNVLVMD